MAVPSLANMEYNLYREVKGIFDPHNLLNPGNIVESGAMTENLRFGESYATIKFEPHIDFSQDQGFDRAIEMCNGAAVCRKRCCLYFRIGFC